MRKKGERGLGFRPEGWAGWEFDIWVFCWRLLGECKGILELRPYSKAEGRGLWHRPKQACRRWSPGMKIRALKDDEVERGLEFKSSSTGTEGHKAE